MNKFLKNIFIKLLNLVILLSVLIVGTIFLNFNHKSDYPATIVNKYERLDSLKNTEKIIICGGSSSSYSIDSKLLQKKINKPVVNTSLAMSLGSKFHLNLVKDYLKKGDIIVYIPEYEFYYGKENGDDFLYTTAFYYPTIIKDFTEQQKSKGFKDAVRLSTDFFLSYFKKKVTKNKKSNKISQYNRKAYNYIGDNVSLIKNASTKIKEEPTTRYERLKSNAVSKVFLDFLKEFNKECIKKGVKLIITFPPVEKSQFDEKFIKDIKFVKKETKIKFIGKPNEYVYNFKFFYDSSYHLNGLGRKLRSEKFIENLKSELN